MMPFLAITRQPLELESCSNPVRIREVFLLRLNFFFVLGLGFTVGEVIMGACFRFFGQDYLVLGANPTSHFLTKAFLETRL